MVYQDALTYLDVYAPRSAFLSSRLHISPSYFPEDSYINLFNNLKDFSVTEHLKVDILGTLKVDIEINMF